MPAIIAGLHLRWDGVWQRPQHILSRLAERVKVIVIEEPFVMDAEERDEVFQDGGVTIVRPVRKPLANGPYVDEQAIDAAHSLIEGARPLVWLYQPLMLPLAHAFPGALVYDCMDDLASFAFAPLQLREFEQHVLRRSKIVFCGGRTLFKKRSHFGDKVKLVPSGVEFERFVAARKLKPHAAVTVVPQPRWGYTGVIDERLDYALLDALASSPQKPQIFMIGPIAKIDPGLLPRKANVHFTGKQAYAALPSILAGLDVALMPFAQNDSTRAISPTKTLEYLAAGLPVVTTPVPDVVADYGEVVTVAEGDAFVRACETARANEDSADVARAHSWDAIVAKMWSEIEPLL
ncbi:MAG: glycosyltransferase [Vulcanimicrobiaceae bacterium]